MKVAINLVGISSGARGRDWEKTKSSVSSQIINCWAPEPVSTYVTTYHHDNIDDLLSYYKPTKYCIIPYVQDQRLTYIQSLRLLEDQDIDFIVSTRFDIIFAEQISTYNIEFDKFNFLFKEGNEHWEKDNFTCDNLFCFPKKFLQQFIDSIQEFYNKPYRECCSDLHPTYRYVVPKIGYENVHFLFDECELSNDNRFYKLDRTVTF